MTTAQLLLPGGIDDASMRALATVLDERWSALPVERVLVWHLESTLADALPFVAELLGLHRPEFRAGAGAPREIVARGAELRRCHGTVWALREVLRGLGFPELEYVSQTVRRYDGSIRYDGEHRYGADGHLAVGIAFVTAPAPLSRAAAEILWDVVQAWKRLVVHVRLGVRLAGHTTHMFYARPTTGTSHKEIS